MCVGGGRLYVIEGSCWRKAFGFGAGLEKHRSGNTACSKALAMEVG